MPDKEEKNLKTDDTFARYENYSDFDVYIDSSENDEQNEYTKNYKLYNFKRPDKFSKEHLRGLQDIHREFSRQLSLSMTAYLRFPFNMEVVSVDQITYDEFVTSMPSPMTIGIFELQPLQGQILVGISFEIMSCIVDRMLGGVGIAKQKNKEFTDIEEALAKRVLEKIIKTFEKAWENVLVAEANLIDTASNYSMVQIASPGEIVAFITLEVQIAGKYFGLINLCLPYPLLESIIGQLSTQHIFHTKGIMASGEEKQNMINKLNTSYVDLNALFGKTTITVKELMELKNGDVVILDNKVKDDLIVKINGNKKFFARAGTLKNKVCIRVTDRYDETTEILNKYL